MDDKTIFTKTAKGLSESVGKTRILPRDLREILKEIDGTSSVEELVAVLGVSDNVLREALKKLAVEEYIHEFVPPVVADDDEFDLGHTPTSAPTDPLTEVTLSAFVRASETLEQDADDAARRDGEARTRRETEDKAQLAAELKSQHAAVERATQQAEEQARRAAEEEARREAEEELKLVAERARRVQEEWARKEAEKLARKEAKAQARKDAKELAQRKAKEHSTISTAAASKRPVAATRTEKEAPNPAGQDHPGALARAAGKSSVRLAALFARRASEEPQDFRKTAQAPVISIDSRKPLDSIPGQPLKWRKAIGMAASIALIAGITIAFTTTYDGKAAQFAALASAQFGQPVKIGKVRLAALPRPHWRFEGISIGNAGQIRLAQVDAFTGFASLFSDRTVYTSVQLMSPVVNEEGLGWLMFGKSGTPADTFRIEELSATGARLESPAIELPALEAQVAFYDGGSWKTIALDTEDKLFHADLQPQGGAIHVDMTAKAFAPPIGINMKVDSFHAAGSATHDELSLTKFSGNTQGGFIEGTGSLKWGTSWKFEGAVKAAQIDTPRLAPHLLEGGKLDGNVSFVMEAQKAGDLLAGARMDGDVTIRNGVLLGVNVASVLRGITDGGRSPFVLLGTEFTHDRGVTQVRNMRTDAGAISTSGNVDIDAKGKLNGHFAVDLKTSTRQTRAFVNLGGTLDAPHYHR